MLLELKRTPAALAAFDKALAIDPNFWVTWDQKAKALRDLGRDAEAMEAEAREAALRALDAEV
jgi:tetratricopeptide (TPR) repeat protein